MSVTFVNNHLIDIRRLMNTLPPSILFESMKVMWFRYCGHSDLRRTLSDNFFGFNPTATKLCENLQPSLGKVQKVCKIGKIDTQVDATFSIFCR